MSGSSDEKIDESPESRCSIAVLIPCFNEETTVAEVVAQFRAHLPQAAIYVFDNASTDGTAVAAERAGATVVMERRRGKGFVVQSMFQLVDADVYVMVDGDGTYPAAAVRSLIAPIEKGEADMVVGSRLANDVRSEFRALNRIGNRIFLWLLNTIFGSQLTDILSGYRAFSKTFAKSIPLFSRGFEIEAELTIKALERGFRIVEVPAALKDRPEGSHSKIRYMSDGLLILSTIFGLARDYKPLTFFGALGILLVGLAAIPAWLVMSDLQETQTVHRIFSALIALGLSLAGLMSVTVGLILHTIVRRFQELEFHLRTRNRLPGPGQDRL